MFQVDGVGGVVVVEDDHDVEVAVDAVVATRDGTEQPDLDRIEKCDELGSEHVAPMVERFAVPLGAPVCRSPDCGRRSLRKTLRYLVLRTAGEEVATETARQHGVRSAFVYIGPNVAALDGLTDLIERGELRPIVGAEFGLADVGRAHLLSESGRAPGKIALYVGQP